MLLSEPTELNNHKIRVTLNCNIYLNVFVNISLSIAKKLPYSYQLVVTEKMVYGDKKGIWGKKVFFTLKNSNIKKTKAILLEKIFQIHVSGKRLKSMNANN